MGSGVSGKYRLPLAFLLCVHFGWTEMLVWIGFSLSCIFALLSNIPHFKRSKESYKFKELIVIQCQVSAFWVEVLTPAYLVDFSLFCCKVARKMYSSNEIMCLPNMLIISEGGKDFFFGNQHCVSLNVLPHFVMPDCTAKWREAIKWVKLSWKDQCSDHWSAVGSFVFCLKSCCERG